MQNIYIGSNYINDAYLGSNQMQNIWVNQPNISYTNLQYWFDCSFSASAANWRANFGNATGSLVNASYQSSYPPRYVLTGANNEILFNVGNPGGNGTAARTTTVAFNTATTASVQNIVWFGDTSLANQLLALQISTSSLGTDAYLKVQFGNSTSSIATNLGPITPNKWYVATLQTTGSTFEGITVWLNNFSQTFTGNTSWTANNLYWINGAANGQNPFSGSIQSNLYYNSYISASAIIDNYDYYKLKLAI